MARLGGFLDAHWVIASLVLYVLVGACWVPGAPAGETMNWVVGPGGMGKRGTGASPCAISALSMTAICEVAQMALEQDGTCQVTRARGPVEAMAMVDMDRPDAAFIDIAFPRTSSLVVARCVINLGIPVLLISGHPKHQRRLIDTHFPFLPKPFSIAQLLAETRLLLDEATERTARLAASLDRLAHNRRELAQVVEGTRRVVERSRAERAARQKSSE